MEFSPVLPVPDSLTHLPPAAVHAWQVAEPPQVYTGKQIYDYMDGAGEIYRAYDFRHLLVQRYACPDQVDILLEVFDMGEARNAFGVFTYMRGRGPTVPIGQDGEYGSGLLCFWKDRYFTCIMIESENAEAKGAVLNLGKTIDANIGEEGARPALLTFLAEAEILSNTLRYFFRHDMLNIHYSFTEDNPLRLNEHTEGILVRAKDNKSYLLLVGYPDTAQAEKACQQFRDRYALDDAHGGIAEVKTGTWTACTRKKQYTVVVLEAPTREIAHKLRESVTRRIP